MLVLDAISWEVIGPLLEWAPLVVVAEAALDTLLQWGIKVDAVVAAAEHLAGLDDRLADHGPVKILPQATGADIFSASLDYLMQTQQSAINIITADVSPIIDTISQRTPPFNISIITPLHRWSLFKSGPYKKWHPAQTVLQIRQPGTSSQITTPTDGLITLTPTPPFWIAESL